MSYHWENVIWQSKDGSWNRGYYHRISMAPQSANGYEEYDSEWDDEFDENSFDMLKTGMGSKEEADNYRPHGNPGSSWVYPYKGNSKDCRAFDQLAHWHKHPADRAKHERLEHLRKNREHFKELQESWSSEAVRRAFASAERLHAELKSDDRAYDPYGMSYSLSGIFQQKGDWLELEGKRIYNLKTDKFDKHVHSLARSVASRFSYGRGW